MRVQWTRLTIVVLAVVAVAALPRAAWAQAVSANGGEAVMEVAPAEPAHAPQDDGALKRLAEKFTAPAPGAAPAPKGEASPLGAAGADVALPDAQFDGGGSWVLSTMASLGAVIGLILLLRWGWMRMGGSVAARATPAVEVLSRTAVAPRNHVLLVRVGGRILVLGDSSGGLRTLADVTEPDEVASLLEAVTSVKGNSITRNFRQMLSQSDREYAKDRLRDEGGDDGEFRIDRARESVSGLLARLKSMSERGAG